MTTSSRRDRDDFGWWPPTVGLIANNRYSEQKSAQLSPEDACSVRQSNTLGFISVNNSRTYTAITFGTVCVDAIVITVAVTQFITRRSADADKPARRVCRSVNVSKHSTMLHILSYCAIVTFSLRPAV